MNDKLKRMVGTIGLVALLSAMVSVAQEPLASDASSETPQVDAAQILPEALDTPIEEIVVSGSHAPPTLKRSEILDEDFIERTDALTVDGVLQKLPANLPGVGETVLVDGRRSAANPATIPVELIDHIEVNADGLMPDGERVSGRVVNIILKKDGSGTAANLRQSATLAGGGDSRELTFEHMHLKDGNGLTVTAQLHTQEGLTASERRFSAEQNHRAWGGRDFRLPWGAPASVQALSGNLNGVYSAEGQPVATAQVPWPLPARILVPSDFIAGPLTATDAVGLRHFNTAPYLDLVTPETSANLGASYAHALGRSIRAEARLGWSESATASDAPPPVTPASALSVVPAAYNPFGQPVAVGLVNAGFGRIRQQSSSTTHNVDLALSSVATGPWTWRAHLEVMHTASEQHNPVMDPALFSLALAAADPLERFDPFTADAPGTQNASLYPQLTRFSFSHGLSQQSTLGLEVHGTLGATRAGLLTFGLAGEGGRSNSDNRAQNPASNISTSTQLSARHVGASGNVDIPLLAREDPAAPFVLALHSDWTRMTQESVATSDGAALHNRVEAANLSGTVRMPWVTPNTGHRGLYQVESELGVGLASSTHNAAARSRQVRMVWMPAQQFTLGVSDEHQQVAPPSTYSELTTQYDQTLVDPLRNVPTATGVTVVSGVPTSLVASVNRGRTMSLDLAPKDRKGWRAGLHYTTQALQDPLRALSAQDVMDNSAVLSSLIARAPASAADQLVNQPGPVRTVMVTPFNAGTVRTRAMDYVLEYESPPTSVGTLAINGRARQLLQATNELLTGVPLISTSDASTPPNWILSGQLDWQRGAWRLNAQYTRTGSGRYGTLPYEAFSNVDVRVSYRLRSPLRVGAAKGPQVGLGVSNLMNADPPFADTLTGYRGGSPLGRTAQLTLRVPI